MDNREHAEKEKELKRERKFLQNIMATVPDSLVVLDKHLGIKSANHSFYELFQTKPQKTIGSKVADLLADKDGKLSAKLAGLFGREDTLENFELRYLSEQLGERTLSITARGVIVAEEEEEEEEELLVVIQDITERKQAERELYTQSEILRNMKEGILLTSSIDRKILYANPRFEEMFDYEPGELIGKDVSILNAPGERTPEEVAAEIIKHLDENGAWFGEVHNIKKDGTHFWNRARIWEFEHPVYGRVDVNVLEDITERKKTEDELQQSEENYRQLAESISDVFFAFDKDLRYTYWNKASEELTGISAEDALGKHLYDVFPRDEETRRAEKVYLQALMTKQPQYFFNDYQLGGKDYSFEISAYPSTRGLSVFVRDITERKKAEEKEQQLQQELIASSRLAIVGQMAAGIAHEINNPLTGVVGFAGLLLKKDIPEDIRKDVNIIYEGAQRIAGITSKMLIFARKQKPERTLMNVNDIIETTLAMRSYEMKSNNIVVATNLEPDLPVTIVDAAQIQQVFLNIIMNAEIEMRKAHNGGNLIVKTERIDNIIRVSFKDDGPGIPKKNMDKLFTPFFTTRDVGEGTGLGLSVSYGIVTQHRGKIYAKSTFGKGATFFVELPIVNEAEQLRLAEPVVEVKKVAGAKILVADDEPVVQEFLDEVLSEEGYEVEIVENGDNALEKLDSEDYDIILLDIKLPGMNGTELYEQIQRIAKPLAKRVIFITGDTMNADTMTFILSSGAAYVTKPFDGEKIKREIDHVLSEKS